uniref:Gastric triacylglycerol lipase n=1 Tax=Aceria tosichella TaxID=561515 RepID=A0A6G1SDP3_9ACAR
MGANSNCISWQANNNCTSLSIRRVSNRKPSQSEQCIARNRQSPPARVGLFIRTILAIRCLINLSTCLAFNLNEGIQVSSLPTALNPGASLLENLSPFHNIVPDAYLDPPEFIRSRGFIPEIHYVTTQDNYIITLHRIINPLVPNGLRSRLKPVLLQHGLFTSSFNFIINSDRNNERPRFDVRDLTRTQRLDTYHPPESVFSWQRIVEMISDLTLAKLGLTQASGRLRAPQLSDAMGFELANQGYDVWMGNSRGSTYSLNHTHYDYQTDWRYWDFSFHEIGLYDLPACIDYILARRKRRSLAYVGHSQGNLAMFILQSFQPEWANKVKPFIALSPIAFIPNVYYGAMRSLIKTIESNLITTTQLNRVLKGQILPASPVTSGMLDVVCVPKWSTRVCNLALTLMLGDNFKRNNDSRTPIIAHHIPEGTSVLNVLHFAQLIESGQFRAFNFGPKENMRRYGSASSPFYPVRNIVSPDIAFISGRTDVLSTMRNVELTRRMLRVPLMDDYVVPELVWGHADHMYAIGAGRLVNAHLIGLIDRYRLVD